MPAEHNWPEPTEDFAYPHENQIDLLKDYFRAVYGRGLTSDEIQWLGGLVSDFLAWSQSHTTKAEARVAALKMIRLLSAIDETMAASRDPARSWAEIALALGLPRVCINHLTQSELATCHSVSGMAVSKTLNRFLRRVDMEPAFKNGRGLDFH